MRAGYHSRFHAFGYPHFIYKVAYFGVYPYQVARLQAQPLGIGGVHPYRVAVGDFSKPLGIGRTRVYKHRQTEGRYQREVTLVTIHLLFMHMALDIGRYIVLGPLPVHHGLRVKLLLARWRGEAHHLLTVYFNAYFYPVFADHFGLRVNLGSLQLFGSKLFHVQLIHRAFYFIGTVFFHIVESRKPLFGSFFGQALDVFENKLIILIDSDFFTLAVRRQKMLTDTQAAIRVDTPRQLNPEFILFPHLTGVYLIGKGKVFALPAGILTQHRLAEGHPHTTVGFVAVDIMTLGGQPHRQHVIGKESRFVPGWRQGYVQPHLAFIGKGFYPAKAIGVSPYRVKHPGKVHIHLTTPFFQEVRQQEAHFEESQRILVGEVQFVPEFLGGRVVEEGGLELVPAIGRGATYRAYAAGKHIQKVQRPRYGPAAQVATAGTAPVVGGKTAAGFAYFNSHFTDHGSFYTALLLGKLRGIIGIFFQQLGLEIIKGNLGAGVLLAQVFIPVYPGLHKIFIHQAFLYNNARHRQQHSRFGSRVGGQPVVGHAGGVGQARVHSGQLAAIHHAFHDTLGMRVEIMARLQVGADQQDKLGIGIIGRRTVVAVPDVVAEPCP